MENKVNFETENCKTFELHGKILKFAYTTPPPQHQQEHFEAKQKVRTPRSDFSFFFYKLIAKREVPFLI